MAYEMGSAPRVRPPIAVTFHRAFRIAWRPAGPISDSPSGLIVVSRASMYTEDCRPEASVNEPRRGERGARRASSAFLSLADMCGDEQSDEGGLPKTGMPVEWSAPIN